jgi:putative hydrolase of the HAD superfamily
LIRNIIFDLGGVLLDIDYQKTIDAFRNLGVINADLFYSQNRQTELFDALERGNIHPAEFITELKKLIPGASESDILQAWNTLLGNFNPNILRFLRLCRKHYRIYLLSNTNFIHINEFYSQLKSVCNLESLDSEFEVVYLSYQTGWRKPDSEIYNLVIMENNLLHSETIFIEDTRKNVDGALLAGIPTLWLQVDSGQKITDMFSADGKFTASHLLEFPQ